MKKALVTAIILGTALLKAFAGPTSVIIDYQGDTLVRPNSIERNIIINSNDGGEYDIAIRPLEDSLRSVDGNVSIPLNKVYINNTREDIYLRYNEYSNLFRRLRMGGIAKNMTAKVRDFGMVPAGTYNLAFEVQAIDSDTQQIASMSTFNLQFVVPVTQQININGEVPRITVGAKDAFSTNRKITNDTNTMIYINSNSDWELDLNADNLGDTVGNYYVRTISGSSKVTERLQERVLLTPGKEIILAKGKAPSNNEYVSVEFSVETKDGKVLPAGNYLNNVRYILRENRGGM